MDITYVELQNRLTVADERNRANSERRNELLGQIKREFGCNNVQELREYFANLKEELENLNIKLAEAKEKAVASIEEIETQLKIAR